MIRKTTLSVSALALMLGLGGLPAAAQQDSTTTDGATTQVPPATSSTEQPAATESTTTEQPAAETETTEEAPAAEAEATTEEAPAAEAEVTTEEAPTAEAEATEEAPAAEAEAATEEAPAAEAEAATEEAPAAEAEAATEEAPAAEAEATTDEAPAAEAEATTEEAPAAEAEAGHAEGSEEHAEEEHGDSHASGHTEEVDFVFEGPFGAFDQNQLQRGLQIYTEVCSACHGLRYVPIRTLADPGGPELPEDQVRAYAAQNFEVFDAELDDTRPAIPSDHFPGSNLENAPDLSLMAKARAGFHGPYGLGIQQLVRGMGGPEHIVSILTGYTGKTREQAGTTFYENTAFDGGWISMAPPLTGGDIEFADGHSNDLHHEAEDVAAFLMWAAEPKMMARKTVGFVGVIFLAILAALLYLTNKRIWAPHKHRTRKDD